MCSLSANDSLSQRALSPSLYANSRVYTHRSFPFVQKTRAQTGERGE